jgi:membrane protein implicated in regulation of membrane protease activity
VSDNLPATEILSKTRKIRRYARITAIAGAGISAASLVLALIPILLVGILMAVLSTMLFVVTKPKRKKVTKAT